MIAVLMLETHTVSLHGYSQPEELKEGEWYDVPPSLASTMIEQGWCEEVQEFSNELKTGPATGGKPREKVGTIPDANDPDTGDNTETETNGGPSSELPSGKLKVIVDIDYLPEGGAIKYVYGKDDEILVPDHLPHEVAAVFMKEGWVEPVKGKTSGLFNWFKKVSNGQ